MRSGWIEVRTTKPKPGKTKGETRYLARIEVGVDSEGKRLVESHVFRTKHLAERWLTQRADEINQPDFVAPSREPFRALLADWLATHDLAPSSRARYEQVIRRHVVPELGSVALCDLTPRHLQRLYSAAAGHSWADQLTAVVNGALELAVRERRLPRNPALGLRVPRAAGEAEDAEPVVWAPAELATFLSSLDGQWHALFHTLAHTGLRLAEVTALRWEDVDLRHATLNIRRRHKTKSGRRVVTLDAGTVAVLAEQRSRGEGPLVFSRPDGRPLAHRTVQAYMDRQIARLGLPRITPHGLRHHHSSTLLNAGVAPNVVQRRLGHASSRTTLDIYGRLMPGQAENVAETFAALVEGAEQSAKTSD